MKNAILITPSDEIEIREYIDYHTINDLVDGWYETCGYFGVTDTMCFIFCNEEYLLRDEIEFNAIATVLANQPIYGNIVLLAEGYDDEGERDSVPLDDMQAAAIEKALNDFAEHFSPILKELHNKYDKHKPKPRTEIVAMSADEFNAFLFGSGEE